MAAMKDNLSSPQKIAKKIISEWGEKKSENEINSMLAQARGGRFGKKQKNKTDPKPRATLLYYRDRADHLPNTTTSPHLLTNGFLSE